VNMPKLNGIEATRQIIRQSPDKKIIGLSFHDGREVRAAMLEAGAVDYLTKNGSVKDLHLAICAIYPKL
jgi:DNA-binding NarL/FixJ family response regulator